MEPHILLQMPLFRGITEETLLKFVLLHQYTLKSYKPGEFIHAGRYLPFSLYSVQWNSAYANGQCRRQTTHHRDSPCSETPCTGIHLRFRKPFPGEYRNPGNLGSIDSEQGCFLEFMHQYPVIMQNFLKLISDRSLFLSKKLNEFALQSLKSRLLNYVKMHGGIGSQQEVAHILGVAVRHWHVPYLN